MIATLRNVANGKVTGHHTVQSKGESFSNNRAFTVTATAKVNSQAAEAAAILPRNTWGAMSFATLDSNNRSPFLFGHCH